jgi:hypothetical protein
MEGLSLSTRPTFPSLTSQQPPHHAPYQFTTKRSQSVRHRRKKARLQPRLASPTSMSPAQDPATGETGSAASRARHAPSLSGTIPTRPRRTTAQSDIHETILHPGNVKINVQGAFIVDEEQPGTPQSEDYEHDPKDIRLPNHTAVVSHIAVDVSASGVACLNLRGTRHRPCSSGHSANTCAHRSEALSRSLSTSPANMATTRSAAG